MSALALVLVLLSACARPLAIQIALGPNVAQAAPIPALAIQEAPTSVTGPGPGALIPTVAPSTRAPATKPPTRIVAPAIALDASVVEVGFTSDPATGLLEWQTDDLAAGFHHGSALPGHTGNTVLSGHHNIGGKVFARLVELAPGDAIDLYVDGRPFHYRVVDTMILPERGMPEQQRQQNAHWIAPTDDERLTLVTCWPADDNSHRVIVVATPVD